MNMKSYGFGLAVLGMLSLLELGALDFRQEGKELIFLTSQTEVRIRNARIVGLKNLKSGTVLADPAIPARAATGGIGNMIGQKQAMSKLHFPWGEPSMNQQRPPLKKTTLYRYPTPESKLEVKTQGDKVTAVWSGLSDSAKFYPNDSIRLEITEADGALAIRGFGRTEDKGIFSLSVPIENLKGEGRFFLPSFGGLEYPAGGKPALIGFHGSIMFYEAKFIAYEWNGTALGYWFEDPTFRPYFAMFERGEKASAFGIEINNLMRFERHDTIETPVLKIATFDQADWVAAARPYRDWYHRAFAEDIARRDSVPWANRINAICDNGVRKATEEVLIRVKELIPAEGVLLHVWTARKLGFTKDIPDYTLRAAYPGEVARAHKLGFKVMCYVCSLCAVYQSPAWERDKVGEFFLTRKNSITNYDGKKNVYDENLEGTLTAARGKDQFGHLKKGAFLYGDPLSKGWRDYFVKIVAELDRISGTDANYQDTLGCTSENGNGIVDGLSGAQGNAALARDLAKNPGVPMASEFGPEPIAFAIKWPLNYAQVWGNHKFRSYRIHHQVPLGAFLFGYRPWIPALKVSDDFHRHLLTAVSDSLGGMGMFTASSSIDIRSGFRDHQTWRSKIFVEKQLKPYFPERKYPENIRSMYQAADGGIYSYYDDGKLQMLLGPDGKPLYGRVNGVSSIQVRGLYLPGWPAADPDGIYGLDPKKSYALFPADCNKPEVMLGKLPGNVMLNLFYSTPEYGYIELAGKGNADLTLNLPERFKEIYVNDRPCPDRRISGELPLRIFFSSGKTVPPETIMKVDTYRGLAVSGPVPLSSNKRNFAGRPLYQFSGPRSATLDAVFEIGNEDDAVEILFRNMQKKYGNGMIVSLCLNGLEIAKFDCCREKQQFDTGLHAWRVPLGKFKGQHVLVSVRSDNKDQNDGDLMFVSLPKLVKDPAQKFEETSPSPANPAKRKNR